MSNKQAPLYIRKKMRHIAELGKKVNLNMGVIEDWLISHGLDPTSFDLNELCEGNDVSDRICADIERLLSEKQ